MVFIIQLLLAKVISVVAIVMCALYQKFHRTREHGGSGAQWGPRNVCKDFLAVEAKRINEAVRNNPDKFPADYMFALTADESAILRSEFSSLEHGGTGKFPADYMSMLTADELSDLRSRFLTANARATNPPHNFKK